MVRGNAASKFWYRWDLGPNRCQKMQDERELNALEAELVAAMTSAENSDAQGECDEQALRGDAAVVRLRREQTSKG